MFVEEIKLKRGAKNYRSVLVRETYRHEGKVLHRTVANLSKLPDGVVALVRQFLRQKGNLTAEGGPVSVSNGREYGASRACLCLARELGLPKMLYSRPQSWVDDAMAMIVGRIVFQGSKLALTNMYAASSLWEQCGHAKGKRPNVEVNCYRPMDRLLERQTAIQKTIAARRLRDGCLIYYDLTSSYMEGEYEESELVAFGYNRDGKKGHEQVAIGLLTDSEGCPVAVEVFSGNTNDQSTVKAKLDELKNTYGIQDIVFAGDRGMLTPKRIEDATACGYKTLTALTHPQIRDLLERKVIQLELFDERKPVEVRDSERKDLRYILCLNPQSRDRERKTRQALIDKTFSELTKLASSKKLRKDQEISARVGAVLARYKIGKFISWKVQDGRLTFEVQQAKVDDEAALDGCYLIRTDTPQDQLSAEQAVARYRGLAKVEQAFRYLKTVALEMRPFRHHLDDRIRAHAFICMLAYYVQWNALRRLQPLFDADDKGADRQWSFPIVLQTLKAIQILDAEVAGHKLQTIIARPTEDQQRILDLLKVAL